MSGLSEIRLGDGTVLRASEWLHWPLYSTLEIDADDPVDHSFFQYIPGQPVARTASRPRRTATHSDTNMTRKGKMNQDEAFVCKAMTYEIFALSTDGIDAGAAFASTPLVPVLGATNLRRLQRYLTVRIITGGDQDKADLEFPLSWLSQSIGPHIYASGDMPDLHVATAGRVEPDNQRTLRLPLKIAGTGEIGPGNARSFEVNLVCQRGAVPGLTQNLRFRYWLDGLKKRPA